MITVDWAGMYFFRVLNEVAIIGVCIIRHVYITYYHYFFFTLGSVINCNFIVNQYVRNSFNYPK